MKPLAGQRIGFIGAGVMGRWMIGHLAAAGAELAIQNRTRAKAEALAAPGVAVVDTPAQAARGTDTLILMVTDTAAVENALFGAATGPVAGVLAGAAGSAEARNVTQSSAGASGHRRTGAPAAGRAHPMSHRERRTERGCRG